MSEQPAIDPDAVFAGLLRRLAQLDALEAENAELHETIARLERELRSSQVRWAPGLWLVTQGEGRTTAEHVADLPDPIAYAAIAPHAPAFQAAVLALDTAEERTLKIDWSAQMATWNRASVSDRAGLLMRTLAAAMSTKK